jgi:hypothetical protein
MTTYTIRRFFRDHSSSVIKAGVTLEEAEEHCNHPSTSSKTATSDEARALTRNRGPWFDGYQKEERRQS